MKKDEKETINEKTPQRNIFENQLLLNHPASPAVTRLTKPDPVMMDKEVIVIKGFLWVQQDKLFSKWKERFIVLTSHYIQFFKKASSRISEMGAFIMKVLETSLKSSCFPLLAGETQ